MPIDDALGMIGNLAFEVTSKAAFSVHIQHLEEQLACGLWGSFAFGQEDVRCEWKAENDAWKQEGDANIPDITPKNST